MYKQTDRACSAKWTDERSIAPGRPTRSGFVVAPPLIDLHAVQCDSAVTTTMHPRRPTCVPCLSGDLISRSWIGAPGHVLVRTHSLDVYMSASQSALWTAHRTTCTALYMCLYRLQASSYQDDGRPPTVHLIMLLFLAQPFNFLGNLLSC